MLPCYFQEPTEEHVQARTQELRLAAVPSLVLGMEPDSNVAMGRISFFDNWPAYVELAIGLVNALQPLASRLGHVSLGNIPISPSLISTIGEILGVVIRRLCSFALGIGSYRNCGSNFWLHCLAWL